MRTRVLTVAVLLALIGGIGCSSVAARSTSKTLDPLEPNWVRVFKVEWQLGEHRGKPVLTGYLANDSPYTVTAIRLLVDGLDDSGTIAAQRIAWLPGGTLTPHDRVYFEVPTPGRFPRYRVRVFTYDRVEGGDDGVHR